MARKLLSISCHVISAFLIYCACFFSFAFLPLFGIFGLLALVCFVIGLAVYRWQSWKRQIGLVFLLASGFTLLAIITLVSLYTDPEFTRLFPNKTHFSLDYFSGFTTTLIVAAVGLFLVRKPLDKSNITKNSVKSENLKSDIPDKLSASQKMSEQPSKSSTRVSETPLNSKPLGVNRDVRELATQTYTDQTEAELLYNQGNVSAKRGMFKNALSFYEQAIALDSTNPMFYNNRAATLKRLGRFKDAIKQYEEIIEKFPNYGKLFLSLGSTCIEINDYQKAVYNYRNFLCAYNEGKFTFNSIIGGIDENIYEVNSLKAVFLTSINYLTRQEQELAVKAFQEAQQEFVNIHHYLALGASCCSHGDFKAACEAYSKAINLAPNSAGAYSGRAYAQQDLGNYESSLADYSKAIQLSPEYADAYLNRATLRSQIEDYEESVRDAEKAAQLFRQHGDRDGYYRAIGFIKTTKIQVDMMQKIRFNHRK